MRRVFKTRHFARWARKAGLTDQALCEAVSEMEGGLIDADLGSYLVKKRISLPGRGKRGGARAIVATNLGSRWFYLVGFAKNEQANLTVEELEALKLLAEDLLSLSVSGLDTAVKARELKEICNDQEE